MELTAGSPDPSMEEVAKDCAMFILCSAFLVFHLLLQYISSHTVTMSSIDTKYMSGFMTAFTINMYCTYPLGCSPLRGQSENKIN